MRSHDEIARVTTELKLEMSLDDSGREPVYRLVPENSQTNPNTWRIRLSPTAGSHPPVYLELNGEIAIGRYDDSPNVIGLFAPEIADQLGISRRHVLVRPSENKLLIIDLGSTNGTFLNSTRLTPKLPYTLNNDDRLSLGHMEMVFSILGRPVAGEASISTPSTGKVDAQTLIPKIARSLTGMVDVGETLKMALHLATFHTGARHMSTWLVDEKTGDLHPVFSQDDKTGALPSREQRQLAQAAANFAPEVIRKGQKLLIKRPPNNQQVKAAVQLHDVLFCYPLKVGDVAIGAIAGVHGDANAPFSSREEKILEAIAEFTAISVHNGLQFARVRETLIRREKLLTGFNYILGYDVKRMLRTIMNASTTLNQEAHYEDVESAARDILLTSVQTSSVIDRVIDLVQLCQNPILDQQPVDLLDVIDAVYGELNAAAHARLTRIDASSSGEPFLVEGDEQQLYQCLYKLVDNAIRHTPPRSHVQINVHFGTGEVVITVRDNGHGFPADDLPTLMDQYYRGAASAEEHSGLGLGLEYVRTAVEAHRGALIIRNHDGGGAECIITLPGAPLRDSDVIHDTLPRKKFTGIIST
jgi:signal transduction histidine kinase